MKTSLTVPKVANLPADANVEKYIISELASAGVHVRVQPAATTSSVYLVFDGGLARSCRIGDHRGKGYKYKYEIGSHYRKTETVRFKFDGRWHDRHLYTPEDAPRLVQDVLDLRKSIILKYGNPWYTQRTKELLRKASN